MIMLLVAKILFKKKNRNCDKAVQKVVYIIRAFTRIKLTQGSCDLIQKKVQNIENQGRMDPMILDKNTTIQQ